MYNPTGKGSVSHQQVLPHQKIAMSIRIRRLFLKLNPNLCPCPGAGLHDLPKGSLLALPIPPESSFTLVLIQAKSPQFLNLVNM